MVSHEAPQEQEALVFDANNNKNNIEVIIYKCIRNHDLTTLGILLRFDKRPICNMMFRLPTKSRNSYFLLNLALCVSLKCDSVLSQIVNLTNDGILLNSTYRNLLRATTPPAHWGGYAVNDSVLSTHVMRFALQRGYNKTIGALVNRIDISDTRKFIKNNNNHCSQLMLDSITTYNDSLYGLLNSIFVLPYEINNMIAMYIVVDGASWQCLIESQRKQEKEKENEERDKKIRIQSDMGMNG